MVADGHAAAGPVAGSQPELLSRMMMTQQRAGYQAYTNYLPPTMISLSPERGTPERMGPVSPATAVYNSPSNENFQKCGGSSDEISITWWSDMTYQDKQWVQGQFATASPTGFQGIKQVEDVLLCQEGSGAIHILDHRVWTAQAAWTFFTSLGQPQNGAVAAQGVAGGQGSFAGVIQRSKDAQAGGQPQQDQAD